MAILRSLNLARRHNHFISYKIKEKLHRRTLAESDYHLRKKCSFPRTVAFNLTYACNLRCRMCGQYGEAGNYNKASAGFLRQRLSLAEIKKIIDNIAGFRPLIYLWGGEPFLHPDFIEIIQYIKQKGLLCEINTNGTLLEKYAEELVEIGPEVITLSLDGPKEIHDYVRNVPGTYDRLVRGIWKINQIKREKKKHQPMLKVFCTISNLNYKKLEETIAICEELQLEWLTFIFAWFTNDEIGERHVKAYKKLFNCNATSWDLDISSLRGVISQIRDTKYRIPISFFPNIGEEEIETYFHKPEFPLRKRCLHPWMKTDILPNGDVTPCSDLPDFVVGNVKEESLPEIWNGKKYRYFRKQLKEKGLFPICSRCCGLYHY